MWLHVPKSALSACAPAVEDSIWDSSWLCRELERSATWREKSLNPPSWLRALKRASWTTRLSGLTCSPSTRGRGAAAFRESLAVSPASPTASPESDLESWTNATSGLPLPEWYASLRLRSASSRTYQASLLTTGESYDPTYRPWVTRLRKASSQRRRSARHTFVSASSSWPTAQTADGERGSTHLFRGTENPTLKGAALTWPTARSHETGDYTYSQGNHETPAITLSGAIQNWPTLSTAPDAPNSNSNQKNGATSLGEAALTWATPTARDPKGVDAPNRQGGSSLPQQVAADSWATPGASDAEQVKFHKGGNPSLSHQAQATVKDGSAGLTPGRVLNPRFVEMLMGWPSGLTDYASSETESYQSWRRRHSVSFQSGLE